MGSYANVPTDELIQRWKDTAEERGSMLEDNRDEDDQDHYDGLGGQLDEMNGGMALRCLRRLNLTIHQLKLVVFPDKSHF